jgi:hypothetical protein
VLRIGCRWNNRCFRSLLLGMQGGVCLVTQRFLIIAEVGCCECIKLCSGDASRFLLVAGHWFVGVVGPVFWSLPRRFLLPGGLRTASRLHSRHIHIFTDNQAAILRASRTTYGPGQELARSIHTIATSLRPRGTSVTLHWVPGHTAIPGNDHADLLAKTSTTLTPTSPPPVSLSWIRRQIHEQYIQD